MTDQKSPLKTKTAIITIAIIISIILYLAGVFSGLFANNIAKKEAQENIDILKKETETYLNELENYIEFLDTNLKSMQLEETFAETLTSKEKCEFFDISLNGLVGQLGFYWDRLPYRLEEFEKNNFLTDEYKLLKEQYTHLSIRIWILAKNQFDKCNTDIVHGLHFYSKDCEDCVKQGEQLDKLNSKVVGSGKDIIMFPIDFNSEDLTIKNLKTFYSINSTPALIINNKVHQGRLFKADELLPS